jgi:hypothetical protein
MKFGEVCAVVFGEVVAVGEEKRAAIDPDDVNSRALSDISAADFLSALDAGGLSPAALTVWPEKKKVELWSEPESYSKINLGHVIVVIKEKKKYELEMRKPIRAEVDYKAPGTEMEWRKRGGEDWGDMVNFRGPVYERLVARLTADIEERLGTRGLG